MSDFFVGQIMMAGFNFAPRYFAQCNGQILPAQQNAALFSLLGAQFGGNGSTTFALPDMRGRTPVAAGSSIDSGWQPAPASMGQVAGTETVTLLTTNLPAHGHQVLGVTTAGDNRNPSGRAFAGSSATKVYAAQGGPLVAQSPQSVSTAGGAQPHPNMQPYTTLNFCIALTGIYPSRQ